MARVPPTPGSWSVTLFSVKDAHRGPCSSTNYSMWIVVFEGSCRVFFTVSPQGILILLHCLVH